MSNGARVNGFVKVGVIVEDPDVDHEEDNQDGSED